MAIPTNWKNQIDRIFPSFGSGKYFIFYAFLFLFSCAILSLQLDNIIIWTLSIAGIILFFGLISKNFILILGVFFPIFAGILIHTNTQNLFEQQRLTEQLLSHTSFISGVIIDLGSSKKGKQRATLVLENGNKIYSYIPAHYSILLGRKIQLEQPVFQSGGLMQLSRGSMGEIKFSSFILGEIQQEYYLLRFKTNIIEQIQKIFPPPESALLNGILVGDDSLMDEDFTNLYRTIGLSHITVVSGSNIAAVLAIFGLLFKRLPRSIGIIISLLGVSIYVLLVGMDPPVLRALFMGCIGLIAITYGDQADTLRILLLTAIILVILGPLSLIYDVGFQLSFLATLGILVSVRYLKKKPLFIQVVGVSIFAGVWTLPISIGSFGSFHLWSIPANVLVGPVVELSMIFGGITLLIDNISPYLGHGIGYIPYFTLFWIQKVAETLSQLPLQITFNPKVQSLLSFLIFGITIGFSLQYLHLRDQSVESFSPSDPL